MESTPLSLAHLHARNASVEIQKSNPIAASEEHDLAAGEFANAAKSTGDPEALRTLKLLENYHQQLADLLKFRPLSTAQHETPTAGPPNPQDLSLKQPPQASSPIRISENDSALSSRTQHPPLPIKLPQRELGSSIASNLASARGITSGRSRRGNQSPAQLSPQHADGKISFPRQRSKLSEQESNSSVESEKEKMTEDHELKAPSGGIRQGSTSTTTSGNILQAQPTSEDPFSRFYATFEGLLSKLSAPLAFAGLPLTPEEPLKPDVKPETFKNSARPSADPDVNRLFSKAALRALRGEHGTGGNLGGGESFYVVPTTGGTISYAGILSRAEREAKSAVGDEVGDDEFVDARETPQITSSLPSLKRKSYKSGSKTMEELELENEALRALADDLSIRLHRFEMGAQNSSMALAMSMRALQSPSTSIAAAHPHPHASHASNGPTPTRNSSDRFKELEEQMLTTAKEKEKLKRENEKLKSVVERYREKWEKLKDGARERMAGAAVTGGGGADAAGGGGGGGGGSGPSRDKDKDKARQATKPGGGEGGTK